MKRDMSTGLRQDTHNFDLCGGAGIGTYTDALAGMDNAVYIPEVAGHSVQGMKQLSQKVLANPESVGSGSKVTSL